MRKEANRHAPWYHAAIALCIAVILYVVLTRFSGVWTGVKKFIGFFNPILLGGVLAYLINPLEKFFERLLKGIKKASLRKALSIGLALTVVLVVLALLLIVVIPQLIESIDRFIGNLDEYDASINKLLEKWGISLESLGLGKVASSSEMVITRISDFVSSNLGKAIPILAGLGSDLLKWLIAFVISVYVLANKASLKAGIKRLIAAVFGRERYPGVRTFLRKCDTICNRYIVFNLIDCLIVGAVNAVFMLIMRMEYVGLISCVVAITNLIPTFGPIIGYLVGGFILLIVNPMHALIFIIFSLLLQGADGYIIKPRLFGNSLGVSGLWILVGVTVGGNMFGILGILIAVPVTAIIVFIYEHYFIKWLEKRNEVKKDEIKEG